MGDIRIVWDNTLGVGDFAMAGPSLELGRELESAVLISLFTDQVADDGDVIPPDLTQDPRGWWADTYEGDQIGSKLWQVFWRVRNQDTLNWARDTVTKCLAWMIEDGVAADVSVDVQYRGPGGIGLDIAITEPSGDVSKYRYAWTQES